MVSHPKKKTRQVVQTARGKKVFKLKENGKLDTGRPSLYTEANVKKLEELLQNDCTIEQACDIIGITRKTFYEWRDEHPTFRDRMRRAKAYPFELAKKTLVGLMSSEKEDIALKSSTEFLKRRDPTYKDKAQIEADIDMDVDGDVTLKDKSMIDLEELRKGLLGF